MSTPVPDELDLGKAEEENEDAQIQEIMEHSGVDVDEATEIKEIMEELGTDEEDAKEINNAKL